MSVLPSYTPIPLSAISALRTLTGDEFKVIGVLCYQSFNQSNTQVTIEQIEALSGIARAAIKPTLMRLIRRGWLMQAGPFYQLSVQVPLIELSKPTAVSYDPVLGVRPPRVTPQLLYPEGPWLTERGFLNEDFVRDRADVWRRGDHYQAKSFGSMAIEDVMGSVCKYYAKPENHGGLEIDWQSYCAKNQRYLQNVQQRIQSGGTIAPLEQADVLKKLSSITTPIESVYESVVPVEMPISNESLPPIETAMARTPQGIQSKILGLSAQKSMPTWKDDRPVLSRLDRLKLWLSDPILRSEAVRQAQKAGYELVYSARGVPIDIVDDADF